MVRVGLMDWWVGGKDEKDQRYSRILPTVSSYCVIESYDRWRVKWSSSFFHFFFFFVLGKEFWRLGAQRSSFPPNR